MSYEGHETWLCENGHRTDFDCYDSPISMYSEDSEPQVKCACGGKLVFYIAVDETNGPDEETGLCPGKERVNSLRVKEPAKYDECPHCHHKEMVAPTTYHIPRKMF